MISFALTEAVMIVFDKVHLMVINRIRRLSGKTFGFVNTDFAVDADDDIGLTVDKSQIV